MRTKNLCAQVEMIEFPFFFSQVEKYYVASGMNSKGVAGAGGVGRMTAEWIINGRPSHNLWMYDIRRFIGHHNNKRFLRDRMQESFG